MTKKTSEGLFFEKRAKSSDGHFFETMPGRTGADFFGKQAMGTASTTPDASGAKPTTEKINVGATGAPVGGQGFRGEGMSGGMYGTGEGTKTAGRSPSDWEQESDLPNGFHRPSKEQPEALEDGGERFFDTDAEGPDFSASSMRHGLKEGGSQHTPATTGHQMGKHASTPPRFLGTSQNLSKEAGIGGEFKESLKRAGRGAQKTLSEGAHTVAKSPEAATALTGLAALMAFRGGKGAIKGIKGAVAKRTAAKAGVKAAPPSLKEKAKNKLQQLIGRIAD